MAYTGWKTIHGKDVYIENGYIIRGVEGEGVDRKPVYMYELAKGQSGFIKVNKLSEAAYRARIKRGTIKWY